MGFRISIPSRGFWFFEGVRLDDELASAVEIEFQSPRGDFGFLKRKGARNGMDQSDYDLFQSPRGDFGFLKGKERRAEGKHNARISIPSRGFWFFEDDWWGNSCTRDG